MRTRLYSHFADKLMFFYVQCVLVAMMVAMETMSQMVMVFFLLMNSFVNT